MDIYHYLELPYDINQKDIMISFEKAYSSLNKDENFDSIMQLYDILLDPERKKNYDSFLHNSLSDKKTRIRKKIIKKELSESDDSTDESDNSTDEDYDHSDIDEDFDKKTMKKHCEIKTKRQIPYKSLPDSHIETKHKLVTSDDKVLYGSESYPILLDDEKSDKQLVKSVQILSNDEIDFTKKDAFYMNGKPIHKFNDYVKWWAHNSKKEGIIYDIINASTDWKNHKKKFNIQLVKKSRISDAMHQRCYSTSDGRLDDTSGRKRKITDIISIHSDEPSAKRSSLHKTIEKEIKVESTSQQEIKVEKTASEVTCAKVAKSDLHEIKVGKSVSKKTAQKTSLKKKLRIDVISSETEEEYLESDTVHRQCYSTSDAVHQLCHSTSDAVHQLCHSTSDAVHQRCHSTSEEEIFSVPKIDIQKNALYEDGNPINKYTDYEKWWNTYVKKDGSSDQDPAIDWFEHKKKYNIKNGMSKQIEQIPQETLSLYKKIVKNSQKTDILRKKICKLRNVKNITRNTRTQMLRQLKDFEDLEIKTMTELNSLCIAYNIDSTGLYSKQEYINALQTEHTRLKCLLE